MTANSWLVPSVGEIVGESSVMQELHAMIERVALCGTTVLVSGETGTGKEIVARTLHAKSGRSGPFVPVNCASLPEGVLESELFGHEQGAFTDAKACRVGLLRASQHGTLLLDEIGEASLTAQARLLRVLQERKVRAVGSDRELALDVRIVVATNRNLEQEIVAGRFRQDLYYRLQVVQLEVPPLRARGPDILFLARHFLHQHAARTPLRQRRFTRAAEACIASYSWPGNVRELEHAIERAVALGGRTLDFGDLPQRVRRESRLPVEYNELPGLLSLSELERQYIPRTARPLQVMMSPRSPPGPSPKFSTVVPVS